MPESPAPPPPCPFEKRFPSQLVRDDVFYMSLAYNQAIDAWRQDEVPIGAIIEGCAEWQVIDEDAEQQEFIVQYQGKGPRYRLLLMDTTARLHREPPSMTRKIHLQGHGGFHSYTLEWPEADDRKQFVPLRAATWARAESEAEHWLATTHPEMYGQVRFEVCEQ